MEYTELIFEAPLPKGICHNKQKELENVHLALEDVCDAADGVRAGGRDSKSIYDECQTMTIFDEYTSRHLVGAALVTNKTHIRRGKRTEILFADEHRPEELIAAYTKLYGKGPRELCF